MERLFSEAKAFIEGGLKANISMEKLEKFLQLRYAFDRGFRFSKSVLRQCLQDPTLCTNERIGDFHRMIKCLHKKALEILFSAKRKRHK